MMMNNQPQSDVNPDQIRILKKAILLSGVVFAGLGFLGLVMPDFWTGLTGVDQDITKIFSAVLVVVGLIDIVLLPSLIEKIFLKRKL